MRQTIFRISFHYGDDDRRLYFLLHKFISIHSSAVLFGIIHGNYYCEMKEEKKNAFFLKRGKSVKRNIIIQSSASVYWFLLSQTSFRDILMSPTERNSCCL